MSRKGKNPVVIPAGVNVKIENATITIKGPKGELKQAITENILVDIENNHIVVHTTDESAKKFHGLMRSLIQNMVVGVTTGFEKSLEMIGVGYRAAVTGRKLDVQVGKSHPTLLDIPAGVDVTVEKNTKITVKGYDKQRVGEFAAEIRRQKPPEVYQGKGIRYSGEYVRKKAGKTASK